MHLLETLDTPSRHLIGVVRIRDSHVMGFPKHASRNLIQLVGLNTSVVAVHACIEGVGEEKIQVRPCDIREGGKELSSEVCQYLWC